MQKRRKALCAAGPRCLQIWAPDTRASGTADKCRRQVRLVVSSEPGDRELAGVLDGALSSVPDDHGWDLAR